MVPAAWPLADVDMDESAAWIAAQSTNQRVAVGIGDQPGHIDAGDEDVRGHALHMVAALLAADIGIVPGVAIARAHDDALAEEGLDTPDREPQVRREAERIHAAARNIDAEVLLIARIGIATGR